MQFDMDQTNCAQVFYFTLGGTRGDAAGMAVITRNPGAARHDPPDLLEFGWTKGH
jgi:hypothetical protein